VSEFEDPARPRAYAPGDNNFRAAINGAAAIGFVRFIASTTTNSLSACTGFFVSKDLLLTNRHCACPASKHQFICPNIKLFQEIAPGENLGEFDQLDEKYQAKNWKLWSRIDVRTQASAPTFQSVNPAFLGARPVLQAQNGHHPLDYALFRVNVAERPGLEMKPVKLSAAKVASGDLLAIPQYPGNYPYVINYDRNCRVLGDEQSNRGLSYEYVPHGCDTAGGSSGSPVFKRDMSLVVGLHSCCERGDEEDRIRPRGGQQPQPADNDIGDVTDASANNRLVMMHSILCDIRKRNHDLFVEISNAQWGANGGGNALSCPD
jgi:V8-like Glu-specific endopeptidase